MAEGQRGRTGDTGRVGDTGRTGDAGEAGAIGEPGVAGAQGERGRRGPRDSRTLLTVLLILSGVLVVLAVVTSTVTFLQQGDIEANTDLIGRNAARVGDLRAEAATREDQTCLLFERSHLADVDQLAETYRYLLQLTPAELAEPLNSFILAALPQTEKEARTDTAPEYCDRPHRGLPEPDPRIPKRPPGLTVPPPADTGKGSGSGAEQARPGRTAGTERSPPEPDSGSERPLAEEPPFRPPAGTSPPSTPPSPSPPAPAKPLLPSLLCGVVGIACAG